MELPLDNILSRLACGEHSNLTVKGFDVHISLFDNNSKIALQTPVYHGNQYIPPSVRQCAKNPQTTVNPFIKTFLNIDENHFLITLEYRGSSQDIEKKSFKLLLEEFSELAIKCKTLLDERDRQDHIYIHAK